MSSISLLRIGAPPKRTSRWKIRFALALEFSIMLSKLTLGGMAGFLLLTILANDHLALKLLAGN